MSLSVTAGINVHSVFGSTSKGVAPFIRAILILGYTPALTKTSENKLDKFAYLVHIRHCNTPTFFIKDLS